MILGIDTSGATLGVALVHDGTVRVQLHVEERNSHDALLVPVIERVLATAGVEAAALGGVAVSAGPGSFTGLRIGFAVAKGFSLAHGTPLLAVPTFDAMARAAGDLLDPSPGTVLATLTDARRGDVYVAEYRLGDGIACTRPAAADTAAAVGDHLPAGAWLCGDAGHLVEAAHPGKFRIIGVGLSTNLAAAVALCGEAMLADGRIADAATCEPMYVREFQTTVSRGDVV